MNCITISTEVLDNIASKAVTNKKLSWQYVERICYSFDDILLVVKHSISLGICFSGIPNSKTEIFLNSVGIKIKDLQ